MAAKNQVTLTFAGDSSSLDRTTAKVSASTKKLGKDFDDLGDRVGKSLSKKLPDTLLASMSGAMTGALRSIPHEVQGVALVAGAGVGAIFASAMGAAVTGGILLALGGGVLAAGIKMAAKDPAVAAAWKAVGDRATKSTALFGESFKGPLIRAAATFGAALQRMAPTLNLIGAELAPVIDKLAPALATMAERALPGIEKAAVASVPLFETLAKHAPVLGDAMNKFFTLIAEGGPGAAKFFDHLLTVIEISIIAFGNAFGYLSKEYLRTVQIINGTKQAFAGIASGIGDAFKGAFNAIARAWNATVGRLSFTIPGWVPGIGGNGFSAPKLPTYHHGGIVSGAMGAETLAVLRAGERVTASGGGSGEPVRVVLDVAGDAEIATLLRRIVRVRGGGNVQAAFGR